MRPQIPWSRIAIMLTCLVALPNYAAAHSGIATQQPPASGNEKPDTLYDLGQRVFAGLAPLAQIDEKLVAKQKPHLEALTKKLTDIGREKDLVPLAGRLSEYQLSALNHFLVKRFNIK